jgi:carbohydrate diacid regulator
MHAVYLLELDERTTGADLHALQLRLQARLPALLTAAAAERELAILEFFDAPGPGHHKQLQALGAMLRELCPQPHRLTMGITLQAWKRGDLLAQRPHGGAHRPPAPSAQAPVQLLRPCAACTALRPEHRMAGGAAARADRKAGQEPRMLQRTLDAWFATTAIRPPPPTRCTSTATRWTTACAASAT